MSKKAVQLELQLEELELLNELLSERVEEWSRALNRVGEEDVSLLELIECESELDAEYQLEIYRRLKSRLMELQHVHGRKSLEFIDSTAIYRPEQSVELFRIRDKYGLDSVVYLYESRHGVFFLYDNLEGFVDSFVKGKDSELRFECRKELELYLRYWTR
ncbi:hypothetical protein ACFSW8_15840 [Rubritalea tangerina]|uniref:Uncharacterized protein n=1 Tax=Rubritalea tangerina TaxID=430798 RepID=A0ABW4ZF81_9BACT